MLVTWEIDIDDAATPEEAARKALEYQRDPESQAVVFTVTDDDSVVHLVDLLDD